MPVAPRRGRFRQSVATLRAKAPAVYPVHVRRTKPDRGNLAQCQLVRRRAKWRFEILIAPTAKLQLAVQLLIHEWGHALAWSVGHPNVTDHDEHFGVGYSRAYRAVFPDTPTE